MTPSKLIGWLRTRGPQVLAGAAGALLLLLFVAPLVALFAAVPGGTGTLASEARDPTFDTSLAFTAYASLIALAITVMLGLPLGYALARWRFPGKVLVESIVTLPLIIPHLIGGLAIFLLFDPYSPAGEALAAFFHGPWPPPWFPVVDTIWGVVLVMTYVSAPYLVQASAIAFRSLDARVVEATRSLGATPAEVFASVTLPLAARGIVAGLLLAWARAISEIGGLLIVAYSVYGISSTPYNGPATQPISIFIFELFPDQIGSAEAAASILVLLGFGIFLVVRILERYLLVPRVGRRFVP